MDNKTIELTQDSNKLIEEAKVLLNYYINKSLGLSENDCHIIRGSGIDKIVENIVSASILSTSSIMHESMTMIIDDLRNNKF